MLPCLRTCRYLPRRHGWTSRRTSSPCWLLGSGIPPWCSGSPWSRSFMWGPEVPCSRCERRLGGFRFPWVGTWTRRAVVVQTGATPQSAWDAYHANPATFDLLGLQMVRSQLDREAISPAHVDRLSTRLAYDRDGIPWSHAVAVFRIWQAGRRAWREPTRVGCPQAGQAELIQAGALLRHLLGATEIDEPFIPPYCLMCCCPTRSVCLSCDRSVCEDGCIWTFQCPLCMGSSSSE